MGLFDIFSKKKADGLVGSMDKLLGIVDQSLLVFRDGVKNYLYNDESSFVDNLSSMASLEFEIENPKIPSELRKEFLKLSELASMAVESTIPGSKAYFTQPEDVAETTERVYFYEKEAVKLSQSIKRTVFHDMVDELKLSEKFHLRYFALHIEDLAKAAVKVAEQLSVMAIKRAL